MPCLRRLWVLAALVAVAGCSVGGSRGQDDPGSRWVLVSNIRYSAQGSEPEYVWVREDEVPTTLTTVLMGKKAVIAPPHVVPRYAPPPGNGTISPLQGGPYAARPAATRAEARAPDARAGVAAGSTTARAPATPTTSEPDMPGVPPRGYVVHIDARRLVIDLTARQGLKRGDIVQIRREKIPIVHPVTGVYLGELDEEVGTAEILELREKFAIAEIREVRPGAEIRVRDRVVPRP